MAYPDYAETMEEWWMIVDKNWPDLKSMITRYYPKKSNPLPAHDMPITANNPETARKNCVIDIVNKREFEPTDIGQYIDVLKSNRSAPMLHNIFNETWFGIPESMSAHFIPGFGVLCDLCSDFPYEKEDTDAQDQG